jgi:hypothetical protein
MQLLPLVIELVTRGVVAQLCIAALATMLHLTLGTGDMCAMAWIPPVMQWYVCSTLVNEVEASEPYIPKGKRVVKGSWFMHNIPASWQAQMTRLVDLGKSYLPDDTRPARRSAGRFYNRHSPSQEKKKARRRNRQLASSLKLITITCFSAASLGQGLSFDSDSFPIAIDNCSSRTMTNSRRDFLPGTLQRCNIAVKGISGSVRCRLQGTVQWHIEDDQGRAHKFQIENTPLCPTLPHRLFSPQHWAQQIEDKSRFKLFGKNRPSCNTNAGENTLSWGRGKFTKTILLDTAKNVAVMVSKPGIQRFTTFAAQVQPLEPTATCFEEDGPPTCCMPCTTADAGADSAGGKPKAAASEPTTVTDDESAASDEDGSDTETQQGEDHGPADQPPAPMDFEAHQDVEGVSMENDIPMDRDLNELYRLHVRAGHLSFSKLRAMARRGDIAKRLADCKSPVCAACQFSKATKKAWRTKSKNRRTLRKVTAPGQCVSVDQIESRTVGFVAQLKGILTVGRYRTVTVFVDHYSRLGYVHLQKDTSSKETLKAKQAFELFARDHGIKILHYHANNGRFVDNAWKESLAQCNQSITYCAVNAH